MSLVSRRSVLLGAAALSVVPMVGLPKGAAQAAEKLVAWDKAEMPAAYPERVLGNPKAPVAIIEYSSLTCPHCAHFHADTLPKLKTEFIDSGKACLVMRDFPLDQLALAAALLARSAPESTFFPFIEVLFANQETWSRAENPAASLRQLATLAGMGSDSLDAAFKNKELLEAIVAVREGGHQAYGIESTPSFVIAGTKHSGSLPFDTFADLIAKATKG